MGYSLSSPCLTSQTVPRGMRKLEPLRNLRLHEDRCTLVALVRVLFVNGGMVFLRVVAALHDARDQLS